MLECRVRLMRVRGSLAFDFKPPSAPKKKKQNSNDGKSRRVEEWMNVLTLMNLFSEFDSYGIWTAEN